MAQPRIAFVAPINPAVDFGLRRKVDSQVAAFRNAGLACDLVVVDTQYVKFLTYARQRIPLGSDCIPWERVDPTRYDGLYIRRPGFASHHFLKFLRSVRRLNPGARIVYEVPTFPYDQEMHSFHDLPLLVRDRASRRKFPGLVDRIADLSGTDSIFGVRTLPFFNGIDLKEVGVRTPPQDASEVRIAFAGIFCAWHGVDRMIRGLADYYAHTPQDTLRPVSLHLMGDGPELGAIRALARELGVEGHCTFYGYCDAQQMNAVYETCTFALVSLGLYRIGLTNSTTLKSGEYLAKGLPFVYAGTIAAFERDPVDFCLQIPNDDSPVSVGQLVAFHDSLYARQTPEELTRRIRAYAEEHMGMDEGMRDVIQYFKEECHASDGL